MGNEVYWRAANQTFADGDRLQYGIRGEVVGPSPSAPDKWVMVQFPGNKNGAACPVSAVRTELKRTGPN